MYPGAVICGGWVVPDTVTPGTLFRCQVNGPNDWRRVRAVVGYVRILARPLPPPIDTVVPPPVETIPVGTGEPAFGDDPADVLLWREDFEGYADRTAMTRGGGGPWDFGATASALVAGRTGQAMELAKPAGTGGPRSGRAIPAGVGHLFASYWFRLETTGGRPHGKWLIIRTTAEGQAGCRSGPVTRHEFALTTTSDVFGVNVDYPRFMVRGTFAGTCAGPVAGTGFGTQVGWFTGLNRQVPLPVLAQDGAANPINDGRWHRWTLELRSGSPGYTRVWLDGRPLWDSRGATSTLPGTPTTWLYELVSGEPSTAFRVAFDDLELWRR